jgi:hypothetical protein
MSEFFLSDLQLQVEEILLSLQRYIHMLVCQVHQRRQPNLIPSPKRYREKLPQFVMQSLLPHEWRLRVDLYRAIQLMSWPNNVIDR